MLFYVNINVNLLAGLLFSLPGVVKIVRIFTTYVRMLQEMTNIIVTRTTEN